MIDRERFKANAPVLALFRGDYSPGQADGIERIFNEWDRQGLTDLRWLAQFFTVPFHETGRRMQPIHEGGGNDYFFRMYDPEGERGDFARANGNVHPGDGVKYHGRGLAQLTWRSNYQKFGDLLGIGLEDNPDLALDPDVSIKVMFAGMIGGLFTGRKLAHFFSDTVDEPKKARQIINGMDKAELLKGYHLTFLAALQGSTS